MPLARRPGGARGARKICGAGKAARRCPRGSWKDPGTRRRSSTRSRRRTESTGGAPLAATRRRGKMQRDAGRRRKTPGHAGRRRDTPRSREASRAAGHHPQLHENSSVAPTFVCNTYPEAKTGDMKPKDLGCAVADGRMAAFMLCGEHPQPNAGGTWESTTPAAEGQGFKVCYIESKAATKLCIDQTLGSLTQQFPPHQPLPLIGRLYVMMAGHGPRTCR